MAPSQEVPALCFKVASEDWEFEQIHQLNYRTFVEEIPQHPSNTERVLIDRFHDQNTYLIAVRGKHLLGMMALRNQRPFSLDYKLQNLDQYLPRGRHPCEVRLLATTAEGRTGIVFRGLANLLFRHSLEQGYDMLLISGTVRQAKLYRDIGFLPFGPLVGTGQALFQPMYLTLEAFREHRKAFRALATAPRHRAAEPLNFLPGPATVHPDVLAALQQPGISHRSAAFVHDFQTTRRELCRLANANDVTIMMGSGTLANEAIAAEITLWSTPGLILTNGAFGERLLDHATRFNLRFRTLQVPWGQPFDRQTIETLLDGDPSLRWVWAVHGETSTGVLNDLGMLRRATAARGLRLLIDAVSALGATPVNLQGVTLASGTSGKGLAAIPGLAFVFQENSSRPKSLALPRYLDLGFYAECAGVPFTVSSNLLYALKAALKRFEGGEHYDYVMHLHARLLDGLRALGLSPVAKAAMFPAVTTIEMPSGYSSVQVGESLEETGYLLHYRSDYLVTRNWLQICLMGRCSSMMVDELLEALRDIFN